MPQFLQAVFFDVDGVLIDSLPQHLQICQDKANEFGLDLEVPTVDGFRQMISRGTKVSPMRDFFKAVGFPEATLDRAVVDYEREFMEGYGPRAFAGVDPMLRALRRSGLKLGIATSNTRANVVPALAESMELFDEPCLFFYDRYAVPPAKSWCLAEGARILDVDPSSCVYVGDQPADARAAEEAGLKFLAVTFGWGIVAGDARFETAATIAEIPDKIAEMNARAP